jgi:hypothetical protein
MKPEDLTISDTVLFLDLSLILAFACFAKRCCRKITGTDVHFCFGSCFEHWDHT